MNLKHIKRNKIIKIVLVILLFILVLFSLFLIFQKNLREYFHTSKESNTLIEETTPEYYPPISENFSLQKITPTSFPTGSIYGDPAVMIELNLDLALTNTSSTDSIKTVLLTSCSYTFDEEATHYYSILTENLRSLTKAILPDTTNNLYFTFQTTKDSNCEYNDQGERICQLPQTINIENCILFYSYNSIETLGDKLRLITDISSSPPLNISFDTEQESSLNSRTDKIEILEINKTLPIDIKSI